MPRPLPCKGCGASVRLSEGEAARLLAQYLRRHPGELLEPEAAEARLASCRSCAELEYGTTCRHCGCLVELRARLAAKHCPRPGQPAW